MTMWDARSNTSEFWNSNFDFHISIQSNKCIQMSPNKPSIASEALEIDPMDFEKWLSNFKFVLTETPSWKTAQIETDFSFP